MDPLLESLLTNLPKKDTGAVSSKSDEGKKMLDDEDELMKHVLSALLGETQERKTSVTPQNPSNPERR